jgi:hypothetical protein
MWATADRIEKTISDLTLGTMIVFVHLVMSSRDQRMKQQRLLADRRRSDPAAARA